ncbi:hypothetical protein V8F20_010285 [Naviculisporaceae sp. PSN 640]
MYHDNRPRRPPTKYDINYIRPASGAPVIGITSREGLQNMKRKMRLHDPGFAVACTHLIGDQTHANRMKKMAEQIPFVTNILGRKGFLGSDYSLATVEAASLSWPDEIPAVLFACAPGDRAKYPAVFGRIEEIKMQLEKKRKMMLICLGESAVDEERLDQLQEDHEKLLVALRTMQRDGEIMAALTWTNTTVRRDEPRHVFPGREEVAVPESAEDTE